MRFLVPLCGMAYNFLLLEMPLIWNADVVAGVPMAILLYRHIGTEIVVDR